ncbi:uncharacterized protein LOC118405623 [Branchiostoma floridae]|uniref:Uncharacterized protein LOC118405623 n=1 Tax=Branchiostoma floridae TaxID=7739 RepID=A0A9J7KIG0_BRAFL|nr:uncharacterized protein LOC118405623 [Branchiostoma floridae]
MSTSSGFFDISPCPFQADDVRDSSHCHLKQAQTVSTNNPSGSDVAQEHSTCQSHNNNISTVLKIIDDIVNESIVDVQNAMKEEQGDLGHHHGNYVPNEPSVSESSHPGGVPVSTVHTNRPSSMPCVVRTLEYRPTPIAELKRRQAAEVNVMAQEHPSSEYDPTCPSTIIGYCPTPITDLHTSDTQPEQAANKYQEAFEYRGTDMEYDPIMNYRCSTFAKQQKKKLPEISEKDSEDVGSAKPVRKEFKTGQDHHASDSCQDNSDPMEVPVVDDLSDNDKIKLQISESDLNNNEQMNVTGSETDLNNNNGTNLRGSEPEMASLTSFGHSITENKMVALISDRDKDTKQLIQSKSSSKETEVSGQLNKLVGDFNVSSVLERGDIKKRKTSKFLKDGNICEDQSQTPKVKRLKKKRVLNLLHDNLLKSSSKLDTTDKISSKLRRRVKVFDEEACPEYLPQGEKNIHLRMRWLFPNIRLRMRRLVLNILLRMRKLVLNIHLRMRWLFSNILLRMRRLVLNILLRMRKLVLNIHLRMRWLFSNILLRMRRLVLNICLMREKMTTPLTWCLKKTSLMVCPFGKRKGNQRKQEMRICQMECMSAVHQVNITQCMES